MASHYNLNSLYDDKVIKATSKGHTNMPDSKIIIANNSKNNVEHKELAKNRMESVSSAVKLFVIGLLTLAPQ